MISVGLGQYFSAYVQNSCRIMQSEDVAVSKRTQTLVMTESLRHKGASRRQLSSTTIL